MITDEQKKTISENIAKIRENMTDTNATNAILLLATKTVDAERIAYTVNDCGIKYIGENRVNELLEKYEDVKKLDCQLHFIGTLQTNKVKYIIDKVSMIHSVDSVKLAAEIDRQAKKHGIVMDILIEINSGMEDNKSGIMPTELDCFIDYLREYTNLRIRGLMTIAPKCENSSEYEKYFTQTYQLFIDILQKKIHNIYEPILSMGMSDSYQSALRCHSNLIRVGSAVFGKRNYL